MRIINKPAARTSTTCAWLNMRSPIRQLHRRLAGPGRDASTTAPSNRGDGGHGSADHGALYHWCGVGTARFELQRRGHRLARLQQSSRQNAAGRAGCLALSTAVYGGTSPACAATNLLRGIGPYCAVDSFTF